MTKKLVVYITGTGTTRRVAEHLASAIGADLQEIIPDPPFTGADLDWTNPNSRSSRQHADRSMRPAIATNPSIDGYSEILVGYPLWWDTAPREVRTWLESHDFAGKTLTTFATSSSSTRGALGEQLHDSAPNAHWVDGRRFDANASEAELKAWADSIA
ncbi:flavodoxin [Bifidobacterium pseudolongum]|uniref:flavodoxin n=1 Tax=Bifidobacterium pseudolongum TaxID=1694 RepID=UPI001F5900ED|nr:flavodoxin [Bifidobacterium pseudolongum]